MTEQMKLPLEGLCVLDLTQVMAGPKCTMIMGDLGAEIIKIESPSGDYSRKMPPHFHQNDSAYYLALNRNKKSMVIDLKQKKGLIIFYDLVKKADIVVDNFRPGVTEKLKINYEVLKNYNEKIISCSITGFGLDSPHANRPALDLIVQAMGGAMSFTGEPDRPPVRMGIPMGDLAAGIFAVIGILSAIQARNSFGVGRKIDISMLDCQLALMTYRAQYYFLAGEIPKPVGSGHVSSIPIRAFKTKDDYLVIDSGGDQFWGKLCKALGIEELADDPKFNSRQQRLKHKDEVMDILEKIFATKPREEWLKILLEAGVPHGPVNNLAEALSDSVVSHRKMVVEADRLGDPFKMIGNPIKMSEMPDKYIPPPVLGQNTTEILQETLNYSTDQINALVKENIVKTADTKNDE